MKEKSEHPVDEGPGNNGEQKREGPLFTFTDLQLQKGAERRSDGKPQEPDRDKPADDPPKYARGATINDFFGQPQVHSPGLFVLSIPAPAGAARQIDDELGRSQAKHRKPEDPREKAGVKAEFP